MNDFSTGKDRDFLEYLVKSIVSDPSLVIVTRSEDELGVLLTLQVGKEDMGRIIGKNGQTAQALRTLLRVVGSQQNMRVNMKIVEPEGEEGEQEKDQDMTSILDEPDLNL